MVGTQHGQGVQFGFERRQRGAQRQRQEILQAPLPLGLGLRPHPLAQDAFLVRRPRAEGAQAMSQGFDVDSAHECKWECK